MVRANERWQNLAQIEFTLAGLQFPRPQPSASRMNQGSEVAQRATLPSAGISISVTRFLLGLATGLAITGVSI